jgi:hypothetical protein
VSQLSFDFNPPHKETFHVVLIYLKLYAVETLGAVVFFLLLTDFAIKEIHPIIISIWSSLK